MIVKKRICDICGGPTGYREGDLKVKKLWVLGFESAWYKCDICVDCANKIKEEVNNAKDDKRREGAD